MTVLLVLFTFAAFLLIDHFRTRNAVRHPAVVVAATHEIAPRLQPALVAGFEVPENLRYHPGHTWALSESPSLVRVGMDDFASKLTGKLESITLPQRGQWIHHVDGATVAMNCAHLLSLANPLAALRQRNALQFSGRLRSEIIHADPHQAGALAERPSVAGVVA